MVQSVFQWVTVFRGFDPTRWEFHWHGYTKELRTGHLQSNLNICVFLNKLAYLWKCQKWNYFCSALGNSAVFPAYCYFIYFLLPPKRLRNHTAFFRKKNCLGDKMQKQPAGASAFSVSFETDYWFRFLFFLKGWPPHTAVLLSELIPLALNYLISTTLLYDASYSARISYPENLSSVKKPEWMYTTSVRKFQGNRFE